MQTLPSYQQWMLCLMGRDIRGKFCSEKSPLNNQGWSFLCYFLKKPLLLRALAIAEFPVLLACDKW